VLDVISAAAGDSGSLEQRDQENAADFTMPARLCIRRRGRCAKKCGLADIPAIAPRQPVSAGWMRRAAASV